MKKHSISTYILCLLPVSAVLLTLQRLETYNSRVHSEESLIVCGYCMAAFLVSIVLYAVARKENRYACAAWIISTLVLAFVFYVGTRIPFCVVCDRVTAEDLGFLIYWIKPEIPPQ